VAPPDRERRSEPDDGVAGRPGSRVLDRVRPHGAASRSSSEG